MIGLALLLTGNPWAMPLAAGSATLVLVGLALFAANVLINVKARAA